MLTQEYLKTILSYDPNTGDFTNIINRANNAVKAGSKTGCANGQGYINVRVSGKIYQAHRLAWLYVYGSWPKNNIDHINGLPGDNRIKNLRDVTVRANGQNRIEHRNGKLLGANYNISKKKWSSSIQVNGKQKHLGYFSTELEAHNKYLQALEALHV